jgi:DNA-binding NarL/FixJ family response regulator
MELKDDSLIRVMIVEDQTLLRESLKRLLESEPGVVVKGEAGTVAEAVDAAERSRGEVDIIILDLRLPDGNGLDAVESLKRALPEARVFVLTSYDDLALVERAMSLHVAGYAPKNATFDELLSALRSIRQGQTYVHPAITRRLVEGFGSHFADALTETELKILQYLSDGLSYGEIAGRLFVSEKTVRRYSAVIFSKMNVSDKAQAVAEALRRGLLA